MSCALSPPQDSDAGGGVSSQAILNIADFNPVSDKGMPRSQMGIATEPEDRNSPIISPHLDRLPFCRNDLPIKDCRVGHLHREEQRKNCQDKNPDCYLSFTASHF